MIRFASFKDRVAEVMLGVVRGKEAWCNTGSRDQLGNGGKTPSVKCCGYDKDSGQNWIKG